MCIAVIESKWGDADNKSIRGIYDLLSDIHFGDHHGYHYETINSKAAFDDGFIRCGLQHYYISINSHGSDDGLCLHNDDRISRNEIRKCLQKVKENYYLFGIHFGACQFLDEEKVRYFYDKPINVAWVSGYSEEIDWVDSTAFDFLFFNRILKYHGEAKDKDEPFTIIENVTKSIKKDCSGLIRRLGFQIYMGIPQSKDWGRNHDNVIKICG